MIIKNIVIFGKVPPPIGGVSVSIQYLIKALSKMNIKTELIGFKCLFKRYDVAHIHYSKPYKRAFGVLIARVFARKVIFSVLGKYFDQNNLFNRISAFATNGIIVLNENLIQELSITPYSNKSILLPPVYSEGIESESELELFFEAEQGKKYGLIYAYNRSFQNEDEVYGVEFLINNIKKIPKNLILVLLDLSGDYRTIAEKHKEKIIYINREVNFISLLKQIDFYLRPTCMDGSSVAVQEALLLGVPVLASDVVLRPEKVETYKFGDFDDFAKKLGMLDKPKDKVKLPSIKSYIEFCENI